MRIYPVLFKMHKHIKAIDVMRITLAKEYKYAKGLAAFVRALSACVLHA